MGLIGGFLVSKLLDHGSDARNTRGALARQLDDVAALIGDRRSHFEAGGRYVEDAARRVRESQQGGATLVLTPGLWQFSVGPDQQQRNVRPNEYLPAAEAQAEQLRIARDVYTPPAGPVKVASIKAVAKALRTAATRLTVEPAANPLFTADIARLEAVAEQLFLFERRVLPRGLFVVAALVAWLTITGVLWPLSVLPGIAGSVSKASILSALAVGTVGLLGYIGYELVQLRDLARFKWS